MNRFAPAVLLILAAAPLRAQTAPAAALSSDERIQQLEQRVDALTDELERLKFGGAAAPAAASSGATPAAGARPLTSLVSSVYGASGWFDKLSLGGYGEINGAFPSRVDQKGDPSGQLKTLEPRRFVLLLEYRFSDAITFRSELEMEHGGTGAGAEDRGEFEVEQAYMDFRLNDHLTARAGHLIVPMGLVNLWHEPPLFHGVQRPSVEQFIIPSTWHETGAGLWGKAGVFEWQTYGVTGGKAVNTGGAPTVDGLMGSTGLAGMSSEGSLSNAEDFAWTARVDARPVPGALVGGSFYVGKADQGVIPASVPVSLWEAHADGEWRGLEARALWAEGRLGNAANVDAANLALNPAFTDFVGSRLWGGYAQVAYDVLALVPRATQYAAPFFRYERYDTAARTPDGFAGDPADDRVEYTAGVTYKPIPQVALKLDEQWKRNKARTGVNQWDLGLGFMF